MYLSPPKGLIVSIVTPFTDSGGIDWASFERLVDRVLPFADGVLIGDPLIGEGMHLPPDRKEELLGGAIERVAGRKALFLCPTAGTPEETIGAVSGLGKKYSHGGMESVFWIDLPLWYHSNRKLPQFYLEWAARTSCPLLVYNDPHLISRLNRSLKRENIRTAVLKRLSENEQIVGVVQAGDLQRTIHYQRAVRMRRDFRFYDGNEQDFLNGPSSSGVFSWGANLFPAEWKEIVNASLNLYEDPGRSLRVMNESKKLSVLHKAWRRNPVWGLKKALHRMGVFSGTKTMAPVEGEAEDPEVLKFLQEKFSL